MEAIPYEIVHPEKPQFRVRILDNAVILHNGPRISVAWLSVRDKRHVIDTLNWLETWQGASFDILEEPRGRASL